MIHSKVIDHEKLDEWQSDIILILCQLEMYFPPSFFDVMVHLMSHIVEEIKLVGPVFLRYRYLFESYMGFLKGYVRNRYRPEGSIVQGYAAEEVVQFCTNYMDNVTDIGLPQPRHQGRLDGVGTIGRKDVTPTNDDFEQAHFTVLQNMTYKVIRMSPANVDADVIQLGDQLEWVLWYAPWLSDQLEWICGMLHGLVINWSSSAIETSRNRVNVFSFITVSIGMIRRMLGRVARETLGIACGVRREDLTEAINSTETNVGGNYCLAGLLATKRDSRHAVSELIDVFKNLYKQPESWHKVLTNQAGVDPLILVLGPEHEGRTRGVRCDIGYKKGIEGYVRKKRTYEQQKDIEEIRNEVRQHMKEELKSSDFYEELRAKLKAELRNEMQDKQNLFSPREDDVPNSVHMKSSLNSTTIMVRNETQAQQNESFSPRQEGNHSSVQMRSNLSSTKSIRRKEQQGEQNESISTRQEETYCCLYIPSSVLAGEKVACATAIVYPIGDGTVHFKKLLKGHMKVLVIKVVEIYKSMKLPVPDDEIPNLESTVKGFIQWPIAAIACFTNAPSTKKGKGNETPKEPNKQDKALEETTKHQKTMQKIDEVEERVEKEKATNRKSLQALEDEVLSNRPQSVIDGYNKWMSRGDYAEPYAISVNKKVFHQSDESYFAINATDIIELLTYKELECGIVTLFEMYRGVMSIRWRIKIYAPQELSEKKILWDYLTLMIDNWNGEVVIMGDFNEVCKQVKRYGSMFNVQGADAFNSFISAAGLEEVPLGLMGSCPNILGTTLDYYLSDHQPILMQRTWNDAQVTDSNAMTKLMKKMKYLKEKIRVWIKLKKDSSKNIKKTLKAELAKTDLLLDKGEGNSDVLNKRISVSKSLQELDKLESMEVAQKAKIKWAIKEDEILKYYHGILNKKRSQLAIRGILPQVSRLQLDMDFPNKLNLDQHVELENNVTREEIKREIWDCEVDKSHGPDGFTFGIYRRCLRSSRGSVIVNGSPTHEFQFHKGLKQGDPLSPFLFILIMESLYILVQRVVDRGMFRGISMGPSLHLSHLFYADDVVFIGISVANVIVDQEAAKIGCATLEAPFSYLGSKARVIEGIHGKDGKLGKNMGNGADTSFWEGVWRGDGAFKSLYPKIYALETCNNVTVIVKMSHENVRYSLHRIQREGIEQLQFLELLVSIEGVALVDMKDRWIWSLEGSGEFSVASV
ncbi:ulp1 protease family, C-terminal catalytic domain-containing protein [Tanacetum coccineum]